MPKTRYNDGHMLQPVTVVRRIDRCQYRIQSSGGKKFAASLKDLRVPNIRVW